MIKFIKLLLLVFIILSCKSELKEISYYPDSEIISSEVLYNSIDDRRAGNYTYTKFDSNGTKSYVFSYKSGQLDGKQYTYYSDGNIERETNFIQGVENGVVKAFSSNGDVITEILCLSNKDIVLKHFIKYAVPKSYGYDIQLIKNDTSINYEGRIIFDTNLKIIDSVTYYYEVNRINSTQDDENLLKVGFLGTAYRKYKTNIILILGELNLEKISNNRYSLKDTVGIIKSDNKNELEFNSNKYSFKNDLITGLLQLELYSLDGKEKIRDKYFTFYYDLKSD